MEETLEATDWGIEIEGRASVRRAREPSVEEAVWSSVATWIRERVERRMGREGGEFGTPRRERS